MICPHCKDDPPNHQVCPGHVHKSWCDCAHQPGTVLNPALVRICGDCLMPKIADIHSKCANDSPNGAYREGK